MKYKFFFFFFSILILNSCQNSDEKRIIEQQRDAKAKELLFSKINSGWQFNVPTPTPNSQNSIRNWGNLNAFLNELNQKPKSTIGAFQKKSKELSKKALLLTTAIPATLDKPEIKSRIAALITKINSINLYLNIDAIPAEKVVGLVSEVNIALQSLFDQLDEIGRRNLIPKEEGEADMIRMLDTARAIPSNPKILPKS